MFDAIVLAGGRAARLDGAAKPQLLVGGVTLLDRVVAAVAGAGRIVVVGPEQAVAATVVWARERPAGGGPVAGLAAGIGAVRAPMVLTLAADLPTVAPAVPRLVRAVGDHDVAVLVDADGRRNPLAAAWRTASLQGALKRFGDPAGASMRALLAGVDVAEVPDPNGWGRDCDTWVDVAEARRRVGDEA